MREFNDHDTRVHKDSYDFPCKNCPSKFKARRILQQHQKAVHSQTYESFTCEICQKQMSSKSKLEMHQNVHKEKVMCEQCNIVVQQNRLRRHIQKKHNTNKNLPPPRHECTICMKKLKSESSLKSHIRYHELERMKPFNCSTCDSKFSTMHALSGHRIIHTSEQPFKCPIAGCSQSFNNSGTLFRHKEAHQKERN